MILPPSSVASVLLSEQVMTYALIERGARALCCSGTPCWWWSWVIGSLLELQVDAAAFDADREGMLVAAQPRPRHVASRTELEGVVVAGTDDGGFLRVDPTAREQAAGVIAGIVHRADLAAVTGEKDQPLADFQPA